MVLHVKDEMNRNVKTLGPNDTVKRAAEKMTKYWMGSVVIVEGGNILGIVTERDVLSKIVASGKPPEKMKLKDAMSKDVITIDEDETIEKAVKLMKSNDIKKLPVTKNGKLSGIITTTDIITAMDEQFKEAKVDFHSLRDLKVLVRRHAIDLKRETEKNQVLTFFISNAQYPLDSLAIIKAVTSIVAKSIYVTLNKPYYSLIKTLKSKGINTDGFYFIDASSEEGEVSKGGNFEKIKSPADMTEIMHSVMKCLESKKFGGLVFDSASTLLVYQEEDMVIRFIHTLINKLRKYDVKGIFLCIKEDMNTSLMKNMNMLADYSVDIEKRKGIVEQAKEKE